MRTLTPVAKALRRNQTDVEKMFWCRLRNRQVNGYKFRRQHQIGMYVVDFVCPEKLLIVELDGGQHGEQSNQDAVRTAVLSTKGYRVRRFWNNEVNENIDGVLEAIRLELERPSP